MPLQLVHVFRRHAVRAAVHIHMRVASRARHTCLSVMSVPVSSPFTFIHWVPCHVSAATHHSILVMITICSQVVLPRRRHHVVHRSAAFVVVVHRHHVMRQRWPGAHWSAVTPDRRRRHPARRTGPATGSRQIADVVQRTGSGPTTTGGQRRARQRREHRAAKATELREARQRRHGRQARQCGDDTYERTQNNT